MVMVVHGGCGAVLGRCFVNVTELIEQGKNMGLGMEQVLQQLTNKIQFDQVEYTK